MPINQVNGVVVFISQIMFLYSLTCKLEKERENSFYFFFNDVTAAVSVFAKKERRLSLPENDPPGVLFCDRRN